ncbi:MAG: hypothetical protein ABJB01_12615 [Rudaea sp.]
MDIYLPADFYALRADLNDWRDVGTSTEPEQSADRCGDRNACADPSWKVF